MLKTNKSKVLLLLFISLIAATLYWFLIEKSQTKSAAVTAVKHSTKELKNINDYRNQYASIEQHTKPSTTTKLDASTSTVHHHIKALPAKPENIQQSSQSAKHDHDDETATDIYIDTLDDLHALFKTLNYDSQSWDKGHRKVPRITFDHVSERWQVSANKIPVTEKKMIFFRLMAPLVLLTNEAVLAEREQVSTAALHEPSLKAIAVKYGVIDQLDARLTEQHRQTLLLHVDILPPSMVLAQAADESGWATSHFTIEGNAFFGQWDFSGKGMKPKHQRKNLGNYGLARFDTPIDSVEAYLLNLNTHKAYAKLRILRAKMRANEQAITGHELAATMDKYSERGQAYVDDIRNMIRINRLHLLDEADLMEMKPVHLVIDHNKKHHQEP